jgi:hypothetical protein
MYGRGGIKSLNMDALIEVVYEFLQVLQEENRRYFLVCRDS